MECAPAAAEPVCAGTHRRPINGYNPAKRKRALESKTKLPEAVRVPPHRMLWPFILVCLSEIVGEVEEFIEENTDLTLKAETDALVAMMRQETPDRRLSKHCYRRIHEALRRPNDQYGVRSLLRRISGASETLEGREELESRCGVNPPFLELHVPHAFPRCCTASISTWTAPAGFGVGTPSSCSSTSSRTPSRTCSTTHPSSRRRVRCASRR